MNDNFNEVAVIEQDLLMTVDDFAKQEGVTARTVYRWIELGRLDTVERLGRKYVNASVPLKSAVNDSDNVGSDMKSENAGAIQNVNIFEEYLKTLRDNGSRFEKSCRRWQMSCFASVFLFFGALFAGTAVSMIYYYQNEILSDRLAESQADMIEVDTSRVAALARIDDLNANMDTKAQPFKDETIRLQKRIDEVVKQNDDLRGQLADSLNQNAILLQRFAELAAKNEELASVDPEELLDETMPQM